MARYRKVDVRIWNDRKFRALTRPPANGQSLWLYLLTNPRTTNIPGLFTEGEAGMAEALGWDLKGFRKAFAELESAEMVMASWPDRVVFMPNAIKYNVPESPNVVRGWVQAWDEIPECNLKVFAFNELKAFVKGLGEAFAKAFQEAFGDGYVEVTDDCLRQPSPNQEQEQEQEQEQDPSPAPPDEHPELKAASQRVVAHYLEALGHNGFKARDTPDKHRLALKQLKAGWTEPQLFKCIDALTYSDWHMGRDPKTRGKRWCTLDYAIGDAKAIERWLNEQEFREAG